MRRVLFSLALLLALLIMPSQVAYAQEETNQSDDLYLFEIDSSDSSYSATKEEKVEAIVSLMEKFGMHTFIINTTNRLPTRC